VGMYCLMDAAIVGQSVAWFSPIYRMLTDVWDTVRNMLYPFSSRISIQDRRIELYGGGVIDFWSLDNADAVRGKKYHRVVIDEAAMIRNLRQAWQAVLRPTLTDNRGDMLMLSTPRGYDFFREMWLRGNDAEDGYSSWQLPTSQNPLIDPSEISAAQREVSDRVFRQEYLAEFITDGEVFRDVLSLATGDTVTYTPSHDYIIGADWAGSGSGGDFTAFVVVDSTARQVVYLDRFSGVSYQQQSDRLHALYERYRAVAVYAELNAMGAPVVESLISRGMRVTGMTTTNASKAMWVDMLALAIEQQSITLLNDPHLIAELQSYQSTRLPSGVFRYSAPDGQHDDCVMALLLAWQGVGKPRGAQLVGRI